MAGEYVSTVTYIKMFVPIRCVMFMEMSYISNTVCFN